MDELMRAIEATLFASAEPLTVDEVAEHVGAGEVEIALGSLHLRIGLGHIGIVDESR